MIEVKYGSSLQDRNVGEVGICSGIRQGCTVSPWLFVMLMNEVIERVVLTKIGFRNDKVKIPILMFADDGLLMAHTMGEMRLMIRKVNEVAVELGMKINKNKSVAMVFNSEQVFAEIEGIKVGESMKYLGMTVNKGNNFLKLHKENKIKACRRFSNLTYSVVQKSCNNVLIGKTY